MRVGSHWERGLDRPSLAFQRRLLEMIARDQRAMEDLRLIAAVERSPGLHVLLDNDLRILARSSAFQDIYVHLADGPNVFHESAGRTTSGGHGILRKTRPSS